MRPRTALTLVMTLMVSSPGAVLDAAPNADSPAAKEHAYEMTIYQFVMLKTGPSQEPASDQELARRQTAHIDLLKSLMDRRRALIVGPVENGGDLRGVVVLDAKTPEEARELLKDDPMLATGRLVMEVHPWHAAKGILQKPEKFLDTAPCFLGLLRRPKDAPQLSEEKSRELQEGHMANIRRMADSGDLVIAGPFSDDGALRGVFVFRTASADRVRELVSGDPSVQAGRLEMDLYTWHVSKGVLPPAPKPGASTGSGE